MLPANTTSPPTGLLKEKGGNNEHDASAENVNEEGMNGQKKKLLPFSNVLLQLKREVLQEVI